MAQNGSLAAGVTLHPASATLDDLLRTAPRRVLLSVAYCCKSLQCEHRFTGECDLGCERCALSQVKQACVDRGIAFRIETTNDDLMAFLAESAAHFDWLVGVACPCEIDKLAPLLWERFHLRQIIFPLDGDYCRTLDDRVGRRHHDARVRLTFDPAPLLALLETRSRRPEESPACLR